MTPHLQPDCCCHCRHLIPLRRHPSNDLELARGPISQVFAFACVHPEMQGGVFDEYGHGLCELYEAMSESAAKYTVPELAALIKEIELLRSQIAMYLKCGIADEQGAGLLEKATGLLRRAEVAIRQG